MADMAAGITRVFPDLTDDLLLNLFHKGAKAQWTSRDLDWSASPRLTERQKVALARLLTPVYFGEQTAMAGACSILPRFMAAGETTAQLYLASFIMDEARHFEALTRLYRALGHNPLDLREMPEMLRYYHRIRQGDRADWVWGILFSDVNAKQFYRVVSRGQRDPLFTDMSTRILQDESRHLAFAEFYLRRNVPRMNADRRRALIELRDDLYRLLESMMDRVRGDAEAFEVDGDEYLGNVWNDVEGFARRIGLSDGQPGPPTHGHLGEVERTSTDVESVTVADDPRASDCGPRATGHGPQGMSPVPSPAAPDPARGERSTAGEESSTPAAEPFVTRCFGCLLSLLCSRRLAPV
jgi:hypothetical protein